MNVKTTCLYMRMHRGRRQYILDIHEFIGGAVLKTKYFTNKRDVRKFVKDKGYRQHNWR